MAYDPAALADEAEGEMGRRPMKPKHDTAAKEAMFRKMKAAMESGDDAAGSAALADFVKECMAVYGPGGSEATEEE